MSAVITLLNGKREYVSRQNDFVELILRELGLEAKEYYEECLREEREIAEEEMGSRMYGIWEKLDQIYLDLKGIIREHSDDDDDKMTEIADRLKDICNAL